MLIVKALHRSGYISFAFILVLILGFSNSYGQKKYNSVYAKEYKQIKKTPYTKKLISLSEIKPPIKWQDYKGGPINTEDSLFHFNHELLCYSFPTNSDKIRNEYLAFYFSQKSAKCPTLFSFLKYYKPVIEKNLSSNQLPKELKLLPAVCSAFNPYSKNKIGGEGYWHLNYPQAIKYGLTVNEFIDERRDFEKSTAAATRYIKDLYTKYNDWELTLAAYSCGVTTVNKLLKRHSAKTYKEIYPYLPEGVKELVQAFVAMNYIYSYDTYGVVNINPIILSDTVWIERELKYEAINHVIQTKTDQFKFLNVTLNREAFPGNYLAHFPKGTKEKYISFKDSIYFYQDSVMHRPEPVAPKYDIPKDGEPVVYKVRSGDVLGVIAERFNVRVSQIQSWNNLSGTRIDIGQKLMIYGPKKTSNKEKEKEVVNKKPRTKKPKTKKPKVKKPISEKGVQDTYVVKSGDNLWLIAKKYSGVSAQNIMDFNNIDANLDVGQVLKIPEK